jgi:beta-lactamase superfamily II metal-dependent hydrolase
MGFEIDFLPVGNGERSGDAIAVRIGNLLANPIQQMVVVIDGGFQETGQQLVDHIKQYYKTDRVDLAISTHSDADHAGGLTVLLEKMTVGQLWMHKPWEHATNIARMFTDGRVTDNSLSEKMRRSLENAAELERIAKRKGIPIIEPFVGVTDPSGKVVVAGPDKAYYEGLLPDFRCTPEAAGGGLTEILRGYVAQAVEAVKKVAESWGSETLTDGGETSAENNSSTIIRVELVPGKHALSTADVGIAALTRAADYLALLGFNFMQLGFIQVPHHGSQRNVGPTILNRLVGPKLAAEAVIKTAFVSAAPDGEPKHPSKKVTNAFRRRGAPLHATQGEKKVHYQDAPDRGWGNSVALPFYTEVED